MLSNYNVSDKDFSKFKELISILPSETRSFATTFVCYLEGSGSFKDPLAAVLLTLKEYKNYSKLIGTVNYIIEDKEISCETDDRLSQSSVDVFLKIFGGVPQDELSRMTPLNFCKLAYNSKNGTILYYSDYLYGLIRDLSKKENDEYQLLLTERALGSKKMEVQSYYKTVASIYNFLQNDDRIKLTDSYLKTISMILAMSYFEDTNDDFNISKEFKRLFPFFNSEAISTKVLGIEKIEFNNIDKYFDIGDLLVNFKQELKDNDILENLNLLFGIKGSNGNISSLCTSLGIDDDRAYNALQELNEVKEESISEEDVWNKYLKLVYGLSNEEVATYNLASIVYNKLSSSYYDNSFCRTSDMRATLSLLISMYLLKNEGIIYLENEAITLDDILLNTIGNNKDFSNKEDFVGLDKRIIVLKFAKFLEDSHYKGKKDKEDLLISNLFHNGDTNLLKVLLISLGKSYDEIKKNIDSRNKASKILSVSELRKLIANIKPELDINSKESIANYGIDLMKQVNFVIDSMLKMSLKSKDEEVFGDIQESIGTIYETKDPNRGLQRFFNRKEKEIIVHFDYVNELDKKIDLYTSDLLEHIKSYELIELRNKIYSEKLQEFIAVAYIKKDELIKEKDSIDSNNVFDIQDFKIREKMLEDKIHILETSYHTMEEHYISVGVAILADNSVINTLTHIKNDFIPLLNSNMLINLGVSSNKGIQLVAKNVVDLTRHYLNGNLENAKSVLENLEVCGIPQDNIKRIESDLDEKTSNNDEITLKLKRN